MRKRGSRAATTEMEKGRGAQTMTKEEKGTHLNGEQLSWQFKERNTLQWDENSMFENRAFASSGATVIVHKLFITIDT